MFLFLEIIGTVAFAISGAMTAIQKKMDVLGIISLGITTAIGGGIIRDIIMGITPPRSLTDPLYAGIALAVSLLMLIPQIRHRINVDDMLFVIIDAIGLGTFTVIGFETAYGLGNIFLPIFLGVLTGVGGGVLRDLFALNRPAIFVKRIYAVASLFGAIVCAAFYSVNASVAMILGIVTVVSLRILAAKFRWNLPRAEE